LLVIVKYFVLFQIAVILCCFDHEYWFDLISSILSYIMSFFKNFVCVIKDFVLRLRSGQVFSSSSSVDESFRHFGADV
jgi:hypothetical protein